MPEGPSIILLKEEVEQFTGKKILAVAGNTTIDKDRLLNQKLISFKTWGKHLLICFKGFYLRVHLLIFGTYAINEKKERQVRLNMTFTNGEINFYAASVKLIEGKVEDDYDFSIDVMRDEWDAGKAKKKLKEIPNKLVCDALLEQDIFSGVGNIIKNEVLYRVKVHPESRVGKIPTAKMNKLIQETRKYSFQFLTWKRNYELKRHWLAHTKQECLRCKLPIIKKYTGVKKRRSFFCKKCQELYK